MAKFGADMSKQNKYSQHPLQHAVAIITHNERVAIFKTMLEAGAKLDKSSKKTILSGINSMCHPNWSPKDSPAQIERSQLIQLVEKHFPTSAL